MPRIAPRPPPTQAFTPGVQRLRAVWGARVAGAREQALTSLLVLSVILGAHLARVGTPVARAGALALVLGALGLQIAFAIARRREARSPRLTLRRVLFATDRSLGERALRALDLVDATERDERTGSPELARVHLSRLVDRATSAAVASAASRCALRHRGLAIACLSLAVLAVGAGPAEVVEGLDVLASRDGRAPLPLPWLRYAKVNALPPPHTRGSERSLVLGMRVTLPKGTILTVRGVQSPPGRTLVFGDGVHDEPFSSDGAGGVVARYTVKQGGTLRVSARFGDVRIEDEEALEVVVVQDAPPEVEVADAPRIVRLMDGEGIDVRWTATDDYGLREVNLVLRSGAREERRVLARFDGETRLETGAHVIQPRDPFLRRAFLPVELTVEGRDNDPLDGPKWRGSRAITAIPPEVGQGEAARYVALRALRDDAADLLSLHLRAGDAPRAEDRAQAATRAGQLRQKLSAALSASHAGVLVPVGFGTFVRGLLDRVSAGRGPKQTTEATEELLLGVDVALESLATQDAAAVSKRLGDVVMEVATLARAARDREQGKEALPALDLALVATRRGIGHLTLLGALGRDLGGVAAADSGRIERARGGGDLVRAELAATHLAARLRRPNPSFGSTGGKGGGGGVESGRSGGSGEGTLPPPSAAPGSFDRAADEIAELSAEHQGVLQGVEGLLGEGGDAEDAARESDAARRHAEAVRRAASDLPLPGEEFGTPRASAALAREHAQAAAHSLSGLSFDAALRSATSALEALDEAERRLDPLDPMREGVSKARRVLVEARAFAEEALARMRAAREARGRGRLSQAAAAERELAERTDRLSRERGGDQGALPESMVEGLGEAAALMSEAARRLAEGKGEAALGPQREAQRIIEGLRSGRTDQEQGPGESGERRAETPPDGAARERNGEVAMGGEVPPPGATSAAEEFRRRVVQGLGGDKSERLAPAIRRYAEGLLR